MKGLITKTIDAENNTKKILLLTEDGKKVCQILLEIFDQWKDATIGDISTDEVIAFSKTLKKLSDNSIDVLS
jgi:DNA-binding MarR family transcriptional regulator